MDLVKARKVVKTEDIFNCVRERVDTLLLPDQDIFNLLYGAYTLQLDGNIWVMRNTVFLHFCGKQKPWKSKSSNRFSALYKHYMNLVRIE